MGHDERDLRRALAARSAAPSPEFRRRLGDALASPRPRRSLDGLAAVAAVVLGLATVAVLLAPRLAPAPRPAAVTQEDVVPPRATPSPLPPATALSIESIQFLTPSVGTVLAGGTLYVTTDGGGHWRSAVEDAAGAGALDQRMSFLDERRGIVFTPAGELKTADGGAHWTAAPAPFAGSLVRSISFRASGEGWALVEVAPAPDCKSQAAAVYHTPDFGTTWTEVRGRLPAARCKSEIAFRDSLHGWVITEAPNGPPVLDETADGGVSWREVALDGPTAAGGVNEAQLHIPVMFDARNGVLPAVLTSGIFGYYTTADGGATWSAMIGVPVSQRGSGVAYDFFDASHWWASSGPDLAWTSSAGTTWTTLSLAPLGITRLVELDVVTSRTAWALGMQGETGVLLRTDDGGLHWRPVAVG